MNISPDEKFKQTIFEENELNSFGKRNKSPMTDSEYLTGDKLVIHRRISKEIKLETIVTLQEYLFEWSTMENDTVSAKDLFYGEIDHSSQLVFVKICYDEKQQPIIPSNIFLPIDKVYHNNTLCTHHVEISLAGEDFTISKKRNSAEKMHIFTQLLLEMEQIHAEQYIHNDEDGDTCSYLARLCESTSGTPGYNAPEKDLPKDNYIHPKTDIYSLGLVFISLIFEKFKYSKELEDDCFWIGFESECEKQFGSKGKLLHEMVKKMVCKERDSRITATECLQLLGITETVDKTDYSKVFFPDVSLNSPERNSPINCSKRKNETPSTRKKKK